MAVGVGEHTTRSMHSRNDNRAEPKLQHSLVWVDHAWRWGGSKQKVKRRLHAISIMWRHDRRVWRQLTPAGCTLMQRLARRLKTRPIPVVAVLPVARLSQEGQLCLVVERHARLEFDPKRRCLVTVPETSHHYVDLLPASASAIA